MAGISFVAVWKTDPFAHSFALSCELISSDAEEAVAMAVYRLFKNEAFEPEAISTMTRAYADVCRMLGLADHDHPRTDGIDNKLPDKNLVAKKVIEFAQRGARDPNRLRDCVLRDLRG
jgi:hypothetical protein